VWSEMTDDCRRQELDVFGTICFYESSDDDLDNDADGMPLPGGKRVVRAAGGMVLTGDGAPFTVRRAWHNDLDGGREQLTAGGTGLVRIVQVAGGAGHFAALTESGRLLKWGKNHDGQCGTGAAGNAVTTARTAARCGAGALADAATRVAFVACGAWHTVAVLESGGVVVFGRNNQGQLGLGEPRTARQPTPALLLAAALDGVRIVGCAAGSSFTLLVSDDGRVFAQGYNGSGQLGLGDHTRRSTPTAIDAQHFGGAPIAAVACGNAHTLAVTRDGTLYGWGSGGYGAAGLGHTDDAVTPQPVVGALAGARVVRTAAGMSSSCALVEDGHVFTWGDAPWVAGNQAQSTPQLLQSDTTVSALNTGGCFAHAETFVAGTPPDEPGFDAQVPLPPLQKPAAKEPDPLAVAALQGGGGGAAAAPAPAPAAVAARGTKRKGDNVSAAEEEEEEEDDDGGGAAAGEGDDGADVAPLC
jgi:hypothetical protein